MIPSMGRTDTPFTHPDEVLWADLEGAIGISFSETSRREIFRCGYIGIMHRNVARDGASTEDAARLCEELIYHTESLIKVIQTARSPEGRLRREEMEALLQSLSMAVARPDFDLVSLLSQLAPYAAEIAEGLRSSKIDQATSALNPEVVGLAHFIAACVKQASSAPARTSPGFLSTPSAVEYRRWGVLLSPKRGHLAELASAVWGRTVTKAQVQYAFGKAKELGLIDRHG